VIDPGLRELSHVRTWLARDLHLLAQRTELELRRPDGTSNVSGRDAETTTRFPMVGTIAGALLFLRMRRDDVSDQFVGGVPGPVAWEIRLSLDDRTPLQIDEARIEHSSRRYIVRDAPR
jgi:hypothetical protein